MKNLRYFILPILLMAVALLSACNNNSNDITVDTSYDYELPTEVDEFALNEEEQLIFDALIIAISYFHNPTAVRVISVSDLQGHDGIDNISTANRYVRLRLQATNRMGGTVTSYYRLQLTDRITLVQPHYGAVMSPKGQLQEIRNVTITPSNTVDISKINHTLIQHWYLLGL